MIYISEKTKHLLEEQTLSNIGIYVDMVEKVRSGIQIIENTEDYARKQGHKESVEYLNLKRLSECSLLIGLIWLDITAAFRIYLNAKEQYEVIYSVKQLTITINEGYKQIYNYVSLDENGNLKTRERNQSFWIKDIGSIVKNELPHLLSRYDHITASLEAYDDQELKNMRGPRNLFVHFDKIPSKVYDELQRQDIEKMTVKVLPFMNILTEMIMFNKVILEDYNNLITTRKDNMLDEQLDKFEGLRKLVGDNPEALELLKNMQDFIRGNKST